MACDVEKIYDNGYRQQYSDLLSMLLSLRGGKDNPFLDQNLCENLEELSEFIRTTQIENDDGSKSYKYNTEAFLGITKLTDHIILEVQRDRDYKRLLHGIRETKKEAQKEFKQLGNEVNKAKKLVKKSRKEAQNTKVELVAILSIFAALVIAFSGGLTYLGGTISSSGDVAIGSTIFSVLICGLMLFNIIAFLMIMILVIVRLNKNEDEPILSHKMIISLTTVIALFNITLIVAIWFVIRNGTIML